MVVVISYVLVWLTGAIIIGYDCGVDMIAPWNMLFVTLNLMGVTIIKMRG